MTITHNDIVNYMRNLATQSVDIADFYRFDIAEIEGSMRSGISYPCMALESHEANFEGSSENNSLENKTFAFTILKRPVHNHFDQQNEYLDDCEIIGKKVLARMRYDSTQSGNILYRLFDIAQVSLHKIGPVYTDGLYGYRFEIALKPDKANFKVNPSDWEDIESVC